MGIVFEREWCRVSDHFKVDGCQHGGLLSTQQIQFVFQKLKAWEQGTTII